MEKLENDDAIHHDFDDMYTVSQKNDADVARYNFKQVALLSQRDRATCLSVEILQLQNIAIAWHYLHDPLAVFTQYPSVTDTPTQTDGQIHDDGIYCA